MTCLSSVRKKEKKKKRKKKRWTCDCVLNVGNGFRCVMYTPKVRQSLMSCTSVDWAEGTNSLTYIHVACLDEELISRHCTGFNDNTTTNNNR